MKILKKILFVLMVITVIPQITSASEIDKIDNIINPNRHQNNSVNEKIMQSFKTSLLPAVRQMFDENNATFKIIVLDKKNGPISEVELIVTDVKAGKSRENQTNKKGEVQLRGLAPTEHTVKAVSAPSRYFFDEDVVTLENNVVNARTIFGKTREDKGKTYKVAYGITGKYGIALKEIEVRLQSGSKKYISKTSALGYTHFEVEGTSRYEAYIDKMSEYFEERDSFKINGIEINLNSEKSIYSSQVNEKMKKESGSVLIINVKKIDKPQEKVLVSLEGRRTDVCAFQHTNEEGKIVSDSSFSGNHVLTVSDEDRLTKDRIDTIHLIEGQVCELDVVLSQSDLSKRLSVVKKKESQDEKLPEPGSKDERMMVLFSLGVTVLAYLYLSKQKRKI